MMKKYDSYKDSGIEWLGELPFHWGVSKLKFHTEKIIDGAHFTPTYIDSDDGVPFLRVTDIHNSSIDLDEVKKIPMSEHLELIKRCYPKKGDLLLSKNGTIGLMKIIDWDWEFSIFVSLCLIKFTKSLKNNFFYYFFQSDIVEKQIFESSQKTSVTNLHLEKIKELVLSIPPIEEQTTIAKYLDQKTTQIDDLISKKERLIELLQEERTAMINQAVTKGLNPNVKMKDSGIEWLGEIPEHWEVKQIKHLGKIINGSSFKSDDFIPKSNCRVLKISNIQTMRIDWSDDSYLPDEFYEKYPNFQINKGDLVFALTRPIISTGIKASIVDCDDKILINQRNAVLKPHNDLNIFWMYYLVFSSSFVQHFESLIDNTGQQPNISSVDIGNIKIPMPTREEQLEIIEVIKYEHNRIDLIISKTQQEIDLLKEYKTALISEVVTGKVKVIDN